MIEFTKSYKVGDKVFASLGEAQLSELMAIIETEEPNLKGQDYIRVIPGHFVDHADKVIDILSTTVNSRPKARRINGARKTRKAPNAEKLL